MDRPGTPAPRTALSPLTSAAAEGDREAADKLGARFMTRTGGTLTVVPADKR
jgi:hypothetical protein